MIHSFFGWLLLVVLGSVVGLSPEEKDAVCALKRAIPGMDHLRFLYLFEKD